MAWLSNDWAYRREITIDNTSNSNDLTDYQVKITLDNTNFDFSHANSDGSDIRFTDDDGSTLLYHWIEKWDSTNQEAIIWVKVPSIPASSNKTIYMYYGNASASDASDGDNTFEFFDDFEGTELDTTKWDTIGNPTINISNGICSITNNGGDQDGIMGKTNYGFGYAIRLRSRATAYNDGRSWGGWSDSSTTEDNSTRVVYGSSGCAYHVFKNGTGSYRHEITLDTEFHIIKIHRVSETKLVFDYDDGGDTYTETNTSYIPTVLMYPHIANWTDGRTTEVDWVCVHKITDPEPTTSVGNEQEKPNWLSGWKYRRGITIQGSSGAGTNYQVLLKVGESSGASGCDFHLDNKSDNFPSGKNEGGDLRFTSSDGTTLLDFWVEKVEGSSPNRVAYIWVEVQDNLDNDTDIYIYFGNSSASNYSNGDDTFEFFDDFDTADYTVIRGNSSQVSVSDSKLRIDATSGYSSLNDIIVELNKEVNISDNFRTEGKVYLEKPDEWIGWFTETSGQGYVCGWYGWAGSKGSIERWDGWDNQVLLEQEISHYVASQGSTQILRWDYINGTLKLWNTDLSSVIATHSDTTYSSFSRVAVRACKDSTWQIDWIYIRKYTDPEPVFSSVGSIESTFYISGQVTLNGNPVQGAKVRAICQDDNSYAGDTTTDENGNYKIEGLLGSKKYHIIVEYTDSDTGQKYNAESKWDITPAEESS